MLLAVPAPAVLSGLVLSVPADEWQIRRTPAKTVRQAADGRRRQQLAWTGDGGPVVGASRLFTLRWSSLGALRGPVERLLAHPGPHTLVLWRVEHLAFSGEAGRSVFTLPWPLAVDVVAPPDGMAAAHFAPAVRLALAGEPLPWASVPPVAFAAGAPPPGEVWFERGGRAFALGTPPAEGAAFYVDVVPVYAVIEVDDAATALRDPVAEPRTLTLAEA